MKVIRNLIALVCLSGGLIPGVASAQFYQWTITNQYLSTIISNTSATNSALRSETQAITSANNSITTAIQTADTNDGLRLDAINNHAAQQHRSLDETIALETKLADSQITEMGNTARMATASLSDVQAAKSTTDSVPRDACMTADSAERAGSGMKYVGYTQQAMRQHGRQRLNSITNPNSNTQFILGTQDRDRVPEFVGTDAGTMTPEQSESYLKFLDVVSPVPPRTPKSLPTALKGTAGAKSYEASFKKYEAGQMYFQKQELRDAVLSAPTIPVSSQQLSLWKQISSNFSVPAKLQATASGDASQFPDHWASLTPTTIGSSSWISERDFLRSEVFKRYANPHYQDDPNYGLASFGTLEGLQKEYIMMDADANRMLYEIMNSQVHIKQLLAMHESWSAGKELGDSLKRRAADIAKN